jgi:predicted ferric reductase
MTFQTLVLVLLAVVAGALSATTLLPLWVPGLTDSLLGTAPKAYWYLARSSAFVAYLMLWLAMMLGLLITNRWARLWPGGPVAFDLHQHASLLGLAITMFHALILLGDRYIHASLSQLLIPFTYQGYRPLWVGAGQLGFYGLLLVGLSFYIRGTIGRSAWRVIHTLSFLVFFGALLHGMQSGTDSAAPAIQLMYWMTGGSVLFFTMYRVLTLRTSKPNEARASA